MGQTIIRCMVVATLGIAVFAPNALAQQPAATISFSDSILNGGGVLPLSRWIPLFRIEMGHAADDMIAARALTRLVFEVRNDNAVTRSYDRLPVTPPEFTIRDFGIFREAEPGPPGSFSGVLDGDDFFSDSFFGPMFTFLPVAPLPNGGPMVYDLSFPDLDVTPPINNEDRIHNLEGPDSNSYIVAFRSTHLWVSGQTLQYEVTFAEARDSFGQFPVDMMNDPIDMYDPDFYDPTLPTFDPGTALASSFAVWDLTGTFNSERDPIETNFWNWPIREYTPLAEHRRPRFDIPGNAFDFVTGEFLETRRLFSMDNWTALLGIDVHSVPAIETVIEPVLPFDEFISVSPGTAVEPSLIEVNLIMTDVGADPLGAPGNGGFNPRTMLESSTSAVFAPGNTISAIATGPDFTFNGAWVFNDSDNNHLFDEPTPTVGTGVTVNDRPLLPFNNDTEAGIGNPPSPAIRDVVPGIAQWEHIPFPPGGGDPWWKIRLRFNDGARRGRGEPDNDPPTGYVEAVPDEITAVGFEGFTAQAVDYFVAIRPDAGFFDSQNLPGDGTGMTFGSDYRAFIEPRRTNPNTGRQDGGIFIDSQDPDRGQYQNGVLVTPLGWQDDPDWISGEPWWDNRSMNQSIARVNKSGVEIHDLVLTYESNNAFAQDTFLDFRDDGPNLGFIDDTVWSAWFDPFSVISGQFAVGHQPFVLRFLVAGTGSDDNRLDAFHFPYETAGFFNPMFDGNGPFAPRSSFFPNPPAQPTLPQYSTWPGLPAGGFFSGATPMEEQWAPTNRRARFLRQRIESESMATAMIGINLVATDDPVTNAANGIFMQRVTVALWGPGFNPHVHLQPVDPLGTGGLSGLALYEDASGDGVFGADLRLGPNLPIPNATDVDDPVPLQSAAFRPNPEPIDMDGDGLADDMSGDGVYTAGIDDAWVIRLTPSAPWPVPVRDAADGFVGGINSAGSGSREAAPPQSFTSTLGAEMAATPQSADATSSEDIPRARGTEYWTETPTTVVESDLDVATKAIGPTGNAGDDLFVIVRTSDRLPRGQLFRVVVPVTLPSRAVFDRPAGIEFTPQTPIHRNAYQKAHAEEGPPERYYGTEPFGVDLIEANIAVKLDSTVAPTNVFSDSGNVPVMKIDISTNRGDFAGIASSSSTTGLAGLGAPGSFVVPGVVWTPGAFTNFFLIDSSYESFEITGNNANTLFLRSSGNALDAPLNGSWIIARSPSFLEQLIVEFYDEGRDGQFDLLEDLLPLSIDPSVSGVKLYRDNDFNPGNVNGEFDPGDIPVPLDYPPYQIGQSGEPSFQVLFDFSSPGTDNIGPGGVAATLASQFPHNRQWVQDSYGISTSDPNFGADFFLVICTSDRIEIGDDFRVGIVSWGANTDTLPDLNTFPPPPLSTVGEFDIFSEFPWGARALGFITFSYSGNTLYKAYPDPDISGFNWVRSSVSKAVQTNIIRTVQRVVQPDDLIINSVTPVLLTKLTAAGGVSLSITGVNFGASPNVTLDGLALATTSSSPTAITAVIPGGTVIDVDNDGVVVLRVTDPATAKTDTFSSFTIINADPSTTPTITVVTPNSGNSSVFPVTITGTNFSNPTVLFGVTVMPVASFTPTSIVVNFPVGGLPSTGLLNVTVINGSGLFAIKNNAFNFINSPGGGGGGGGGFGGGGGLPKVGCFIATAAYDGTQTRELTALRGFRDDVLLKSAFGAAFVDAYYSMSPPIADAVAERPWMAAGVRAMLTPIARTIEQPAWLIVPAGLFGVGMVAGRMRRRKQAIAR